jgi:hypothetical protein
MGSEYFINNEELQAKIRDLLPSQGGAGAGFDLSASTQIIPIIDLTETAEGSNVRADLQTAMSFNSSSVFSFNNTTQTIISNTGYYRVFGTAQTQDTTGSCQFRFNDGSSTKRIIQYSQFGSSNLTPQIVPFDFIVFIDAGITFEGNSTSSAFTLTGATRQIASIDGTLQNP